MAKKVVWTESAWTDLETVADFIARDSPYYAASFLREIHNHAHSLRRMSARGRLWELSFTGSDLPPLAILLPQKTVGIGHAH